MLKQFGEEIWIVDGGEAIVAGFRYPTRMTVIRLRDGSLFVCSPTRLSPELRDAVHSLGQVRHLVAPNSLHHLFLQEWKCAWPEATLYAPPGLRRKRTDILFDADLGDVSEPDWLGEIDQVQMRGCLITTEIVFFHTASGTAIFTDLVQQFAPASFLGWRALAARLDLMTGDEPSVPRKFRVAFVNRHAARESLKRILVWPVRKVLMAHGTPVQSDVPAFLNRAFHWLIV